MEYIGIDVHASESQICTLTEQGEILERRVRTHPERFEEVLGGRTRWFLVEAARGMIRHAHPGTAELRAWAVRIAARRGRRIAPR